MTDLWGLIDAKTKTEAHIVDDNLPVQKNENDNIFPLMFDGDKLAEQIHENVTLVVGKTRSGKSTFFNWVLKKKLMGAKGSNADACYMTIGENIAKVASGRDSVTTLPNVHHISYTETFVDMAGYNDIGRTASKVLIVSYMLKAVMERAKSLRFALVIPESYFTNINSEGILSIFDGFLDMFNFNHPRIDVSLIRKASLQMFNSVKIVITFSEKPESVKTSLQNIVNILQQKGNIRTKYRAQIFVLLSVLLKNGKFLFFPKAKIDQLAPVRDFFETPEAANWKYFNLLTDTEGIGPIQKFTAEDMAQSPRPSAQDSAAEKERKLAVRAKEIDKLQRELDARKIKQVQAQYFILPFQSDFIQLPPEDQAELKFMFEKRVNSFQIYIKILRDLFEEVFQRAERFKHNSPQITSLREKIIQQAYINAKSPKIPKIIQCTQQLITLVETSITIQKNLSALSQQINSPYFQEILKKDKDQIAKVKQAILKIKKGNTDFEIILDFCDWRNKYFRRLEQFVSQNDYYNLEKMQFTKIENKSNAEDLILFTNILNCYELTSNLKEVKQFQDFYAFQDYLIENYILVAEVIENNFCGMVHTRKLLEKVKCILRRGKREVNMLYFIAENEVQSSFRGLKDNFEELLMKDKKLFIIKEYFRKAPDQVKEQQLSSKANEQCFQLLLDEFQGRFENEVLLYPRSNLFFSEVVVRKLSQRHLTTQWTQKHKNKEILTACLKLLSAIDLFENYYVASANNLEPSVTENKMEFNHIVMKRMRCLRQMMVCLEKLNEFLITIQMAEFIKCIHTASIMYRKWIDSLVNPAQKIERLGQFAAMCIKWGRNGQALCLYQEQYELTNCEEEIKKIMIKILELQGKPISLSYEAKKFYKEPTFPLAQDSKIAQICKSIQQKVFQQDQQEIDP